MVWSIYTLDEYGFKDKVLESGFSNGKIAKERCVKILSEVMTYGVPPHKGLLIVNEQDGKELGWVNIGYHGQEGIFFISAIHGQVTKLV